MQGKTKLPELENEFRKTARAILKKRELEEEFEALLAISDEAVDSPYQQAILEVADIRMDLAEDIKKVIDQISATKSKAEKADLREAQKELMDEMGALPDLGTTFEDWEEMEAEGGLKKSVGRPPVPFEVNLIRAREDAEVSFEKYQKMSKKEGNPSSIEDKSIRHPIPENVMIQIYQNVTQNMGKDSRDELGVLDSEIRKLDAKIDHIISGEEEREREEKLSHAKYSSKGTRLGRPFQPIDEMLAKYESERESLETKRNELTSKLSAFEQMDRRIKLHEDKIRDLRRVIRAEGWDPKKDSRDSMPFGEDLNRLELEVQKLRLLKKDAEKRVETVPDKRAERDIKRRIIMQNELMRQHDRDEKSGKKDKSESIAEGLDQLEREIGMF